MCLVFNDTKMNDIIRYRRISECYISMDTVMSISMVDADLTVIIMPSRVELLGY